MKRKVVVVEDNAVNIELVTQMLEDEYDVIVAMDGRAGVEAVGIHEPDLVLMDLSLPEMDGFTAIAKIRAMEGRVGQVPILVLSAHVRSADVQRALAAGANDYLTKPLVEEVVLARLAVMIMDGKQS